MKKFFPLLLLSILISASHLLAQQASNLSETAPRTWFFGTDVKVKWSVVNVLESSNEGNAEISYNAMLTIENYSSNNIENWSLFMTGLDEIKNASEMKYSQGQLQYCFEYSPLSQNVIPANSSFTIYYYAIAKQMVHSPANLIFRAPAFNFEGDPYNN